jgi:hypothetical protein
MKTFIIIVLSVLTFPLSLPVLLIYFLFKSNK